MVPKEGLKLSTNENLVARTAAPASPQAGEAIDLAKLVGEVDEVDRRIREVISVNKNKSLNARQLKRLQRSLGAGELWDALRAGLPELRSERYVDNNFRNHLESGRYPQLTVKVPLSDGSQQKLLLCAGKDLRWPTLYVAGELRAAGRYHPVAGFEVPSAEELEAWLPEMLAWVSEVESRHVNPGAPAKRGTGSVERLQRQDLPEPEAERGDAGQGSRGAAELSLEGALANKVLRALWREWMQVPKSARLVLEQHRALDSTMFLALTRMVNAAEQRADLIVELSQHRPVSANTELGVALRTLALAVGDYGWVPSLEDGVRVQLAALLRLLGSRFDRLTEDEDHNFEILRPIELRLMGIPSAQPGRRTERGGHVAASG